jgi:hypothetical protein
MDAWRFLADVENPNPRRDQFPGWPHTISQFDNFGKGAENVLPEIVVNKPEQLVQIREADNNELVRIFRMNGQAVQVKLHEPGTFNITIGEGDEATTLTGISTQKDENDEKMTVEL